MSVSSASHPVHPVVSSSSPHAEGEFDVDSVHAAPGEVADWDELITNIRATAEDVAKDYKDEDSIVPGFAEGIQLRPWQVQGRHWMLERESGNKRGGILADDVSLVILNARRLTYLVDGSR